MILPFVESVKNHKNKRKNCKSKEKTVLQVNGNETQPQIITSSTEKEAMNAANV